MSVTARRGVALPTTDYSAAATFRAAAGIRKVTIIVRGGTAYMQVMAAPGLDSFPSAGTQESVLPSGFNAKTYPGRIYGFRLLGSLAGVTADVEYAT